MVRKVFHEEILVFILKGLQMKKVVMIALCLFALEIQGAQHRKRNSGNNNNNVYDMRYTNSYDPRPTSTKRPPHYDDFYQEQKRQQDARAQMTKAIANKFDMDADETFTSENFRDLASQATPQRPFFLAIVAAPGNNYHFFSAPELAAYGKLENPINRQRMQQIIIYRYNGQKSDFPFDYVETIDAAQMPYFQRVYRPHSRL